MSEEKALENEPTESSTHAQGDAAPIAEAPASARETAPDASEQAHAVDETGASRVEEEPAAASEGAGEEAAAEVVVLQEEPAEDPVEVARAETKRMREQMLRIAADFDNFRKRARRESEDAARRAKEDVLRELLPVFDNLERAVGHADQATDAASVAAGIKIVLKQFVDTAGRLGVARIQSVGTPFDPNFHEAIQQLDNAELSPGTVLAEVLPGYLWGDRLLRAAMVIVSKVPAEPPPPPAEPSSSPPDDRGGAEPAPGGNG